MEHNPCLFLALTCILFMAQHCLAAPSADDLAKFGEMERSIRELASSILALSGATAGTRSDVPNRVWPEELQA
ncbi:uncharacterized protein LOC6551446 [Drosophila erecta]|uniref:Uncharacterized protein n=1 Tax=Drosophila erecta TaxID=7220 RepID=B3NTQ8_DROER|nr:uncharacterized protein LOC6551446 [Drosophila erecta]EDV47471.2 uncharacterized protein Dere_GG19646 [Drosophila erecta]